MEEETQKLQQDLERARAQLYIFYEITKVMRTTLRLEEIVYIILTGLTAHHGLAFNRAALFLADETDKAINGFMGIGPIDGQEADEVWQNIENEKKDLYDLIEAYHQIKEGRIKPRFLELIQSLSFPFGQESGLIFTSLFEKCPLHFSAEKTAKATGDPLVAKLQLSEFLVASLWMQNRPAGLVVVDNSITGKAITDEDIKIFNMFVEQAAGAIENSQTYETTLTRAHTDSLTGLWNYGYFQYKLDEELERARRNNQLLSIMMVDIDEFKRFNDSYGHIEGDSALQALSQIFKDNCRKIDIVCRYGGEEFSLIIPSADKEETFHLGERIRKSVEQELILKNKFTISIGIAGFPQDALSKEALIRKADSALYQAKSQGKNKVVLA